MRRPAGGGGCVVTGGAAQKSLWTALLRTALRRCTCRHIRRVGKELRHSPGGGTPADAIVNPRSSVRSRAAMQLETIALRHQLAVCQRSLKGPRLGPADRLLWSWLARLWSGWREALRPLALHSDRDLDPPVQGPSLFGLVGGRSGAHRRSHPSVRCWTCRCWTCRRRCRPGRADTRPASSGAPSREHQADIVVVLQHAAAVSVLVVRVLVGRVEPLVVQAGVEVQSNRSRAGSITTTPSRRTRRWGAMVAGAIGPSSKRAGSISSASSSCAISQW